MIRFRSTFSTLMNHQDQVLLVQPLISLTLMTAQSVTFELREKGALQILFTKLKNVDISRKQVPFSSFPLFCFQQSRAAASVLLLLGFLSKCFKAAAETPRVHKVTPTWAPRAKAAQFA